MDIGISTDTFFKFCATLGLTLIIFNTYYSLEMMYNAKKEHIQFLGDYKYNKQLTLQIEKDIEFIDKKIESAEKIRKIDQLRFDEQFNKKISSEVYSTENESLLTDLKLQFQSSAKAVEELYTLKLEILNTLIKSKNEITTKEQLYKHSQSKSSRYICTLIIGDLLGLVLAIFGFLNWIRIEKIFL